MHRVSSRRKRSLDVAQAEWRRRSTRVLMLVSVAAYLPLIVILVAGRGPALTAVVRVVILASYLALLVDAMLWWTDYRTQVWVNIVIGYILSIVGGIALPQGPFMRALPVILPMVAMVLLGRRAGGATVGFSIVTLLLAPTIGTIPALAGIFTIERVDITGLPDIVRYQGIALTALLVGPMLLLDRYHDFLMLSLSRLEQEAHERAEAYRQLEDEMQERRRLEHEVARAADDERRRLGHEIHDGVCQQLTGALLRSEALTRWLEPNQTSAAAELSALSSLLAEAIDETHAVAQGLSPLGPEPEALVLALQVLSRRVRDTVDVACSVQTHGEIRIADASVTNHLYRIAQEAVSNAVKHARANRITITLRNEQDELFLDIDDDGVGIPTERGTEGMGLRTMSYRAHLIEGELNVVPNPSAGTRISCRVPLRRTV